MLSFLGAAVSPSESPEPQANSSVSIYPCICHFFIPSWHQSGQVPGDTQGHNRFCLVFFNLWWKRQHILFTFSTGERAQWFLKNIRHKAKWILLSFCVCCAVGWIQSFLCTRQVFQASVPEIDYSCKLKFFPKSSQFSWNVLCLFCLLWLLLIPFPPLKDNFRNSP